ncbi:glucose-6-phosphate 1-dehydrogenase [Buchnera aphidicola (Nipponaphis monzeni)]|uniref:Glucose-6-phosphate 1-dehydrogenase n=1 Tax=Buchnera aphidicola (Nipponaphis monzeni) TaxID=2495405 RepID=A0A455TA91_9GAMM|nr:glucose-6-phosphate dehydrogenase [Buchnera aphidicola]BBI01261.1 glucose-6-phosphate 1-dehydrogenase [Buchnera aphidicola (Nipponaphis monzeni)]
MINLNLPSCDFVIFGTKGDLAKRKLFPSLYRLDKANKLYDNTRIIGVGRADWNKKKYLNIIKEYLKKFMKEKIENFIWTKFSNRLEFCNIDVNNMSDFAQLKKILNDPEKVIINYFAMPPNTFSAICRGLGAFNLNNNMSRIIIEKPLGSSFKTSQIINNQVAKYFQESQIFRIDHYLGKETVLNLLSLRFANSLFSKNWDNNTIDHIQITVAEEVGIEGRWKYFNEFGQMRDMVQNHLLQLLSIIAMEQPINFHADSIRNEKVKVLQSLSLIKDSDINKKTVIGQYTSGYLHGKVIPSYLDENGSNKKSNTETFVSLRVDIDNIRWKGVPFYLRTGKRLPCKCSEIVIFFKKITLNFFSEHLQSLPQNKLIIRLEPNEGLDIQILNKIPSLNLVHVLKSTKLDFCYSKNENFKHLPSAYERLLLECMLGMQSLFVRRDEVEEAWKWVDSIIYTWEKHVKYPELYSAGTWGPLLSNNMIIRDGRFWS